MRALALALALLAAPAVAQVDRVQPLVEALALTSDQADLVAEVYDPRDPASVWTLTAELWPTLSADQRAALFAAPERPGDRPPVGRGEGAGGRRGAGRGGRSPDPAQLAVARAARDAALGLDADQSAALDAVLDDLRGARTTREPGAVPDAVAALLTPDQADLYRAHRALLIHLRRARGAGRR